MPAGLKCAGQNPQGLYQTATQGCWEPPDEHCLQISLGGRARTFSVGRPVWTSCLHLGRAFPGGQQRATVQLASPTAKARFSATLTDDTRLEPGVGSAVALGGCPSSEWLSWSHGCFWPYSTTTGPFHCQSRIQSVSALTLGIQ